MAYISQYEVDMQQDAQNKQNQAAIGNSVLRGFQGIEENRQRAIAERDKRLQQGVSLAQIGATAEDINNYNETGSADNIFDKYTKRAEEAKAKAAQDALLDKRVKESQIYKNMQDKKGEDLATFEKKKQIEAKYRKDNSESGEALEVPGYGHTKTKKEALDIRAAKADADDAIKLIDKIKEMGTNVSVFDRERINLIEQAKKVLAGKLRLPLTGPGAMTEDEYQRLIETMGDPSNVFSTESIQKAKLDQLKDILNDSVSSKFKASAANNQPEQYNQDAKMQRLEQLRAKKTGVAMGGN